MKLDNGHVILLVTMIAECKKAMDDAGITKEKAARNCSDAYHAYLNAEQRFRTYIDECNKADS